MNKIFDDDSALKQKKQNECFSPEKEININEFRAISIDPRRTPLFCPRNTYSLLVCLHFGSNLFTFKSSKTLQKKGIEQNLSAYSL